MKIETKEFNSISYKVVNGTFYHIATDDKVIEVLENARVSKTRIRVWFGADKKVWAEDCDVVGVVSRTTGIVKAPILKARKFSSFGSFLGTDKIVKIKSKEKVLYQIDWFNLTGEVKEQDGNYPFAVYLNGVLEGFFETAKRANRWLDFMLGKRFGK